MTVKKKEGHYREGFFFVDRTPLPSEKKKSKRRLETTTKRKKNSLVSMAGRRYEKKRSQRIYARGKGGGGTWGPEQVLLQLGKRKNAWTNARRERD